ncbi:MAG: hypothetical protein F6J97_24300 [Leptolyngbya sp. SIO4C1]|nr:hypothetical protein [Leptolyngbya sp. SIO4C1]
MFAVELQAEIRDGKIQIEIPEEYQENLLEGDSVKLVILKPDKKFPEDGIIAQLTQNPIPVKGIRNLKREEIYEW